MRKIPLLMLAITLHDFPEGRAIALPLRRGGMSRGRATRDPALLTLPCLLFIHKQACGRRGRGNASPFKGKPEVPKGGNGQTR